MSSILALDQGTTSSRAMVVHQDGRVLATAQHEFPQFFPAPGLVEHDPRDLFDSLLQSAREAIAAAGEQPVAIGIANQRETTVLWDRRTLEPVGPAIVWQDRRTAGRCSELKAQGLEPVVRQKTGLLLDPYFSATKLETMLRDPVVRRRAGRGELAFGTVDSWIVANLTGGDCHVTDPTNASRTLLYSLAARQFDPELLALFDVPFEIVPTIVPSSGILGESRPGLLGPPIPIGGIAGDQQAALFGQGCVTAGMAKNTYGTGAFLLMYAGDSVPAIPPGLLATVACNASGGVGYAVEGSVFIAGAAIQWLRDGLGLLGTAAESEALARSVPDTGGVAFVPALVGLGSPHWEPGARGTITGLTRGTTRAHLVRAALESIALSSRDLLATMIGGTGLDVPRLRVDGGAAANDWLMQFQADVLGLPVERPDLAETTALGAAALAGLAVGAWPGMAEFGATRRYRSFVPGIAEPERAFILRSWNRAVSTALHWAKS